MKRAQPRTNASAYHAQRVVRFLRLAKQEGDPQERERLLTLAKHAQGQAKLYRMVDRRGSKKPIRGGSGPKPRTTPTDF